MKIKNTAGSRQKKKGPSNPVPAAGSRVSAGKPAAVPVAPQNPVYLNERFPYLLAGTIAALTFLVYLASLRNGFVLWDDDRYIYENSHIQSLDAAFFKWAFFGYYSGNWHPLTWISHALDYAVWGLNPIGHHLTNTVLHALNTFLVVLLATRLITAWRERAAAGGSSLFSDDRNALIAGGAAGLLFGLHPLHVESVAWASERKDLLCALFYLLGMMSYLQYARQWGDETALLKRPWPLLTGHYCAAAAFFCLALMSKPMAVSFPVVLLILDWYPLSRIRSFGSFRDVCIEKIPFAVLTLASSAVTLAAQEAGGALSRSFMTVVTLPQRLALAAKSLIAYLGLMVWPVDLVPLYTYPKVIAPLSPEYIIPVLLVAGITAGSIVVARKRKLWPALWSTYVITLLPVLGIVQVGVQAMADRYAYLPSIPPFLLAGMFAAWVYAKMLVASTARTLIRIAGPALALVVVGTMIVLTLEQIGIWKDSIVLWTNVIEKQTEIDPIAYGNRGVSYANLGEHRRAIRDFDRAIALDRYYAGAYYERGSSYAQLKEYDHAVSDYSQAIMLNQYGATSETGPEFYYLDRGRAYLQMNNTDLAIADFRKACELGNRKACDFLQSYR